MTSSHGSRQRTEARLNADRSIPPAYTTVPPLGQSAGPSVGTTSAADRSMPPAYATMPPAGHDPFLPRTNRSAVDRSIPSAYATVTPPGHEPSQASAGSSAANPNAPPAYATVPPTGHAFVTDVPRQNHTGQRRQNTSHVITPNPVEDNGDGRKPGPERAPGRGDQYDQSSMSATTNSGARPEEDYDDDEGQDSGRRRPGSNSRYRDPGTRDSHRRRRRHETVDYGSGSGFRESQGSFHRRDMEDHIRDRYDGRYSDSRAYRSRSRSGRDRASVEDGIGEWRVRTLDAFGLYPELVEIAHVLRVSKREVWTWAEAGCFQLDLVTGEVLIRRVPYHFPPRLMEYLNDTWGRSEWDSD